MSVLHSASKNGNLMLVEQLIKSKKIKEIDRKDNEGFTALRHAVAGKHENVAVFLIKSGADFNLCNKDDLSTLNDAAKNGNSCDVVERIIRKSAEINKKDKDGLRGLHCSNSSAYTLLLDDSVVPFHEAKNGNLCK